MEELVLNNRRVKLIDGEIYAWKPIKNPYWRKVRYSINQKGYYFISLNHNNVEKYYLVSRIIYKLNNPDWDIHDTSITNIIDHIDNNKENNSIENLRVVNQSQNCQNRNGVKGYTWVKRRNKYQVQITINYKSHWLGLYDTEEEAREAYLNAKEIYHTH